MKNETKAKEKSFTSLNTRSFISVVIILVLMIATCGILSTVIPQGQFLRTADGEIIAGTYTQGGIEPISFWKIISAPFRVFITDGNITIIMISVFLLIMSGVFNLLDKTNGIKVMMNKMVAKFGDKKRLVIAPAA